MILLLQLSAPFLALVLALLLFSSLPFASSLQLQWRRFRCCVWDFNNIFHKRPVLNFNIIDSSNKPVYFSQL